MKKKDDEKIVRKSRCNQRNNYSDPFDWAGGILLLTKSRLIFRPHSFNFRKEEESIPLANVVLIEARHSEFISNKFSILLRDGTTKEFRVPKRKSLVKDIKIFVEKAKGSSGHECKINGKLDAEISKKSIGWFLKLTIKIVLIAICVSGMIFLVQILIF